MDSLGKRPGPIGGLKFRQFRGGDDYDTIGELVAKSWDADHVQWTMTADDYRLKDEAPINQDPANDRLIAEVEGVPVGFSEVTWQQLTDGPRIYRLQAHVVPEWRPAGVRKVLLRRAEARIRKIAEGHPPEITKAFDTWANDATNDWKSLLLSEGYAPSSYSLEMVRRDLEDIPELVMPNGVEIRQIGPEDVRRVWEMSKEAMRDHRNYSEAEFDDAHLQAFLKMPICRPDLWAVAWAGDRPVGVVCTCINEEENLQYDRRRGHTESIGVVREWRRKGIASALVARSLRTLKEHGMTSATLDVDSQNPSGALRVYRRLGFEEVNRFTFFRKPLDE